MDLGVKFRNGKVINQSEVMESSEQDLLHSERGIHLINAANILWK